MICLQEKCYCVTYTFFNCPRLLLNLQIECHISYLGFLCNFLCMFGKLKTKRDFLAGKMLLCDMPFSSIFLLNNYERSGSWPNMFLFVVGTHTKCVINEFALDARTDILIFPCHTVTNGIDLRRSPP